MNSSHKSLAGKSPTGLPITYSKITSNNRNPSIKTSRLQQSYQTSVRSISRESENEEEDHDDDDDDGDDDSEDSERVTTTKSAAKVISAKDLEWTQEEQQSVMKFYGLETLFPTTWGDDNVHDNENQKSQEKAETTSKAVVIEDDTSDPLEIRGKIKRPKWMKNKPDVSIFISEKTFSPKIFLREVHKNTDFKELEQAVVRLKQSIAERNKTTKGLVKKHFAKFVNAKTVIDSFYKEMKAKNLVSREDYGVAPFLNELSKLEKEANALYGPVLERRAKAAKLRVALCILEQWRFFFNLASSLKEMVRKGRYDAAVRDYKKGKNIIQSSFKDDRKDKSRFQFGKDESLLPKNYQAVFEKIWIEVEKVAADFREELFVSLRVASTPIETQEKIICYLNELDSKRDPVWCYLDTQYTWVLENLIIAYNRHLKGMRDIMNKVQFDDQSKIEKAEHMEKLTKSLADLDNLISRDYLNLIDQKEKKEKLDKYLMDEQVHRSVAWDLNDIKKALLCVTSESFETQFGKELLVCLWKKTQEFVSDLSQILTNHLPSFFRTCRMAIDEKYIKKTEGKKIALNDRIRDSQSMINNVFDMIRIMIDYIFFINKTDLEDDEASSEDEYSDENQSLQSLKGYNSIIELKKYKDYKSSSKIDLLSDADSVWKTFQHLSGSLIKLPAAIFSSMVTVHPLILIHYATQIMDDLHDCIDNIKISCPRVEGFALIEPLEITVDSVKSHLVRTLCAGWVEVSKAIHQFEFWEFENHAHSEINPGKVKQDSTHLMKLNNKLFKLILRSLAIVLFGSQTRENQEPDFEANQHHIEKIRHTILECIFGVLDGLQWHVGYWRDPEISSQEEVDGWIPELKTPKLHTILPEQKFKFGQFIPPDCAHFVETIKPKNFKDLDTRSIMTLSNIQYLLKITLPESRAILKEKFNLDITLEEQHIFEISSVLRRIIIMNYAKRQHVIIGNLVKNAILYSGLDWGSLKSPIPIRPQFMQLLQHLIYIHASISDVSKTMVQTVFSEILLFLVQELLLSYRQIDSFNIPGMLQATLETEFVDTTLKAFATPQSEAMFIQLYDLFEKGTNPDEEISPEIMNEHLSSVKLFLEEAKNATVTQFRCFTIIEEVAPILRKLS